MWQVQRTTAVGLHAAGDLDAPCALTADGAGCRSSVQQDRFRDFIRIRERRLVARYGAYTDALVNGEATGLDDALFQAPALALGELEIEVGVIDLVRKHGAQCFQQLG